MYGFDAAAGGAEALSSRTGVTAFTLSAVQDCSRQSPPRLAIALFNWFGPIIQVSRGGTDDVTVPTKAANDFEGRPAPWFFNLLSMSRAGFRPFGYEFGETYAGIATCNVVTQPRAPDMGEHAQEVRTYTALRSQVEFVAVG